MLLLLLLCRPYLVFFFFFFFFVVAKVGVCDNPNLNTRVSVRYEAHAGSETNPFNRTKSSKLPLQVFFSGIIAQTRHEQGLESIASDLRIIP